MVFGGSIHPGLGFASDDAVDHQPMTGLISPYGRIQRSVKAVGLFARAAPNVLAVELQVAGDGGCSAMPLRPASLLRNSSRSPTPVS